MEHALEATETALEGAPRVGPVLSATSRAEEAYRAAQRLGLQLFSWQRLALWQSMATNPDGRLKYREFAGIVSRRNGKTKKLNPRVLADMDRGRRVLHTAHNRMLPRKTLLDIANLDRGRYKVRQANGQEEVRDYETGGSYKILAPLRGARGEDGDTLIVDEIREFEDWDFIAAAEPIVASSDDPQVIYLSNAGWEGSVVLNDLRHRALNELTPDLCYMEWSSPPELTADDETGWLMANPAIGEPGSNLTLEYLRTVYEKYLAAGELAIWETEHLCRWTVSMMPRLVQDPDWQRARRPTEQPQKPAMGVNVDPSGTRVSIAYAWSQSDGSLGLTVRDFTGSPVDLTALAVDLLDVNRQLQANRIGFDPWTDQHLARHFPGARAINGSEFANASERFVRAVESGMLRWQQADPVSADLPYTARKPTTGSSFIAARADEHRSISGVLAAIRAVWIASAPKGESVIY